MFAIVNGIIMVPLYLSHMPLSTYGAWLASGNVIGMVGVVESGFSSVITQKMAVAHSNGDRELFGELAAANFIIAFLMAAFIFLGGLALCPFIPNWVNADPAIVGELKLAIMFSTLATASTVLFSLTGVIPQVIQRTFHMGVINSSSIIVGILVTLFGILGGLGILAIALGYFIKAFFNFVALSFHVRRIWRTQGLPPMRYSPKVVKALIRDCSLPFVARISSTVVNNSQNFIIASSISPASAAVYEITSKVVIVVRMFVNMMNGSVMGSFSLIFANANVNYQRESYRKMGIVFFSLLIAGMLFAFLFTEPIVHCWVGSDKFGGTLLLGLVVLAALAAETKNFFSNLLMTMGLIKRTAQMDIFHSFLFLAALGIFIKIWPMLAIPLAILCSSAVFMAVFGQMIGRRMGEGTASAYSPGLPAAALAAVYGAVGYFALPKMFGGVLSLLLLLGLSVGMYFALLVRINAELRTILNNYLFLPIRRKFSANG